MVLPVVAEPDAVPHDGAAGFEGLAGAGVAGMQATAAAAAAAAAMATPANRAALAVARALAPQAAARGQLIAGVLSGGAAVTSALAAGVAGHQVQANPTVAAAAVARALAPVQAAAHAVSAAWQQAVTQSLAGVELTPRKADTAMAAAASAAQRAASVYSPNTAGRAATYARSQADASDVVAAALAGLAIAENSHMPVGFAGEVRVHAVQEIGKAARFRGVASALAQAASDNAALAVAAALAPRGGTVGAAVAAAPHTATGHAGQEAWPRSQLQRRQVCMWLGWCRLLMLGLVPTPPLCKHLWAQLVARLRPLLQLREVMMRRGQQWMKQG